MLTFEKIKDFYNNGYWTKEQVHKAVSFGKIDATQYQLITNEPY